jgi:hypothetical protein
MAALKNRQMQVPHGMKFQIPEVKWRSAPFASFDTIVNQATAIINSNPALQQTYPTDRESVAALVDQFNTMICQQNGWTAYITGDPSPPPPKPMAPASQTRMASVAGAVKRVNAGAALLLEWEKTGEPPVESAEAVRRSVICETCPQNGKGDLTSWFTVPAAELIRGRIGRLHSLKLTTPSDEKLGVCMACMCPLKLKVWAPLPLIKKHLSQEVKNDLPAHCWILDK